MTCASNAAGGFCLDKLAQMTTFVRVVELGGFAAAARDLRVAPSLVTTHIQALEQRLGVRLLNRNTRSVKPTEVGEAYYERCLDLLKRFEVADDYVQSMQAVPRGVLRLNVSLPVIDLITPVVSDYTELHPEVSVRMIMSGRDPDLIDEQFDLAIRHLMPSSGSLLVRKLAEAYMVVCASPKYFATRSMPEKPSDLVNHNCLIYTDSGSADRWPIFSSDTDMSVHGNFSSNSIFALRDAAERGLGIVVLPQYAAAASLAAGRLIPILQQYTTVARPVVAVYPHRGLVPTKTTVFVDMLKKHIPRALAAVACPLPQTAQPQPDRPDGSDLQPEMPSSLADGENLADGGNVGKDGVEPRRHAKRRSVPRGRRVAGEVAPG
jgi:DNA-binding transcriptional LysR family regulator